MSTRAINRVICRVEEFLRVYSNEGVISGVYGVLILHFRSGVLDVRFAGTIWRVLNKRGLVGQRDMPCSPLGNEWVGCRCL
jgi:hypothetical protein